MVVQVYDCASARFAAAKQTIAANKDSRSPVATPVHELDNLMRLMGFESTVSRHCWTAKGVSPWLSITGGEHIVNLLLEFFSGPRFYAVGGSGAGFLDLVD